MSSPSNSAIRTLFGRAKLAHHVQVHYFVALRRLRLVRPLDRGYRRINDQPHVTPTRMACVSMIRRHENATIIIIWRSEWYGLL